MATALKVTPKLGSRYLPFIDISATTVPVSPASALLMASAETNDVSLNLARTLTWATSLPTTQRAIRIQAPTYACSSVSTITTASTVAISGPPAAGTNATITNAYAVNVETGKVKVNNSVVLQNDEYIANATDGSIDLMPSGISSSHYGLRVDATSWGFGPTLIPVRASDGNTTAGFVRFLNPFVMANDVAFSLGNSQAMKIQHTATGNDTLQIMVTVNNAAYSGAVAIIGNGANGAANRSPATAHTNPNLYIYGAGTAAATEYTRLEHDTIDGRIATGKGQLSLEPATSVFINSGFRQKRTATATNYTVLQTDSIIGVTSTAAARTITLPSAVTVGAGTQYIIKDESGGAATNNISIASVSSQTFDGAASPLVINANYGSKRIYSDGSNWFTI